MQLRAARNRANTGVGPGHAAVGVVRTLKFLRLCNAVVMAVAKYHSENPGSEPNSDYELKKVMLYCMTLVK